MNLTVPVHWGGGKIYHSEKKRAFRVYARHHDRVERVKTYGADRSNANRERAFKEACQIIVDDARPVVDA
jgi:hypothetical protein